MTVSKSLIIAMAFIKGCLSPQVIEEAIELGDAIMEEEFGIDLIDTEDEKREREEIR